MKHAIHSPKKPNNNKAAGPSFLRKAKADVVKFSGSSQDAVNKPKNSKKFKPRSRKEARKQQRQLKKVHRLEHYAKKHGKFVKAPNTSGDEEEPTDVADENFPDDGDKPANNRKRPGDMSVNEKAEAAKARKKIKNEKEAKRQRIRNLRSANKDEDKIIKQMEKHLKLNKRKSKSLPKSFMEDGLDYLLDLCNEETRGRIAKEEMDFGNVAADFEDDLAAVVGKPTPEKAKNRPNQTKTTKNRKVSQESEDQSDEENNDDETDELDDEEAMSGDEEFDEQESLDEEGSFDEEDEEKGEDEGPLGDDDEVETRIKTKIAQNRLLGSKTKEEEMPQNSKKKPGKNVRFEVEDGGDEDMGDHEDVDESEANESDHEEATAVGGSELWEDIYGRLRDKAGNVVKGDQPVNTTTGRYVPPFRRLAEDADDTQLRRTLKGLLNRLAESNMASVAKQSEELYLKHSRQSMHKMMSGLFLDSLVSPVLTPERLIQEHALLLSVLHANVGMEIGAMMLETLVKTFDEQYKSQPVNVPTKELDNLLLILAHMYNFKVVGHTLMYGVMNLLLDRFAEKDVELLVLGFKTVGFGLRKDDPVALKQLIVSVQAKASQIASRDQSRLKFMLEVIMAIRNNHMAKIPGYDYSHVEHLKKLSRGLVRKGTVSTPLQVRYDEILSANSRGRWWVVGSAWEGHGPETKPAGSHEISGGTPGTPQFSAELLELARKQRMNTDVRRGIFCILMTAEDIVEAFERLMRLGLKGNQEREILHVILHCSLHEKEFNPYYVHLASRFCLTDRKYQLNLQFALWDKFREITELKAFQVSNLAKLIAFLLSNQALPLTVLKAIEFSSMDRTLLRFMRQLLLAYLLQATEDSVQTAFTKLKSDKYKILREGLRLFLHHFLLKNADKMPEEECHKLQQKVQLVDRAMASGGL